MPVRLPALNPFLTARPARGFTLLELLVVISIMALATAGVSIAMRDNGQTVLEREGARLAALLESGRAQSRATGAMVRWRVTEQGFRFEGLPPSALPSQWPARNRRAATVHRGVHAMSAQRAAGGFTLVEVLVALAIVAIALLAGTRARPPVDLLTHPRRSSRHTRSCGPHQIQHKIADMLR